MPASNRRPLYDDADAPQASDITPSPKQPDAAALAASSSTPVNPAAAALAGQAFKQPCTFKGAASALYAGALGYFLGVVPATIKFKARQWGMIHTQGLGSAQQLAVMSGMYTAVHCICQRIRMVEDGWNRGIAGCSTGLVLGWSNGPWSALQSCAGLGLISALIDLGGGVEAAEARALQPWQPGPQQQQQQQQQQITHQPASPGVYGASKQQEYAQSQQLATGPQDAALSGLPQPVQMLALLLGASPATMGTPKAAVAHTGAECSSSSSSSSRLEQHEQGRQQQLQPHQARQRSSRQHHGLSQQAPEAAHKQQLLQPWQQAPLTSAAALLQPAARAAQQLIAAAPPLMFLGACCHSNAAHPAAAAAAGRAGAVPDTDIDGCPLAAVPAVKASGSKQRH